MMPRTPSRLWLLVAATSLGAACSSDRPATPTAVPAALASDASEDAVAAGADDRPTTYAVIGDTPYEPRTPSAISVFPTLIASINADPDVRRVVHIGDIKSGSTLCSDRWFRRIADNFTLFDDPLVYAIGDNEWTDCHRSNNGGYLPTDRLAQIRQVFFSNPGRTLGGKHQKVNAQPGYPENSEWRASDVEFATFHIVGSNNGLGQVVPGTDAVRRDARDDDAARDRIRRSQRRQHRLARIHLRRSDAHARQGRRPLLPGGPVEPGRSCRWRSLHRAPALRRAPVAARDRLRPSRSPRLAATATTCASTSVSPGSRSTASRPVPNITQIIVDRSIEAPTDASPIDWVKLTIDPSAAYPFSWTQIVVP